MEVPGQATRRRAFGLSAKTRFIYSFGGIAAVFFSLYFFPYARGGAFDRWTAAYLAGYARMVGAVLRLADPAIAVSHNEVIGRFSMSIVHSCDAMEVNILFCAATLATPGAWWRKAVAVAGGVAALVTVNVLRLCCLYWVGLNRPALFDFFHVDLWPLLMVAFAVLDYVLWLRWLGGSASGRPAEARSA